jgi:hypothetical protein
VRIDRIELTRPGEPEADEAPLHERVADLRVSGVADDPCIEPVDIDLIDGDSTKLRPSSSLSPNEYVLVG